MSELGEMAAKRIRAFVDTPDHHSLYDHQSDMLHAVAGHFEGGEDHGTVKSATGTGKTYTLGALAVASEMPTVIVTPRKLIGQQTIDTFMDGDKFNVDVAQKVGLYDSEQKNLDKAEALEKPILVTTYPSFIKLVKDGKISTDPKSPYYRSNIILDEAHRATGEGFREALKPFTETGLVTAWTATDGFMNGDTVNQRLFDKPGRIYTLELRDAVEQGRLCHAITPMAVEVAIDGESIEALRKNNADYPTVALERFAANKAVQEHALRMYLNYEDEDTGIRFYGKPLIVNTSGVNAAKETAALFNSVMGEGQAVVVSGDTPTEEREQIFADYKSGKIKVLCAADLLIEGFDSPDVSVVFSLRPSQSPWLVEQMLGRGARKQSDEYYEQHGHDKQLFAVNFFGKGMQPLLFNDVLGGKVKSKIPPPPRPPVEGSQQEAPFFQPINSKGVEIISYASAEDFETIARQRKENALTRAPVEMYELDRSLKVTGGDKNPKIRAQVTDFYTSCREQLEAGEDEPVTYHGKKIRCGWYRDQHDKTVFCIDRAHLPELGIERVTQQDHMLSMPKFLTAAGLGTKNSKTRSSIKRVEKLFTTCEQQFQNGEPTEFEGQPIECGYYESARKRFFWIDAKHVDSLGLTPLEERPKDRLTEQAFTDVVLKHTDALPGTRLRMERRVRAMFAMGTRGHLDQVINQGTKIPLFEGQPIPGAMYKTGYAVDQALAEKWREEVLALQAGPVRAPLEDRPEDRLTKQEFIDIVIKQTGASIEQEIDMMHNIRPIFAQGERDYAKGITGPSFLDGQPIPGAMYKEGYCIDKSWAEQLRDEVLAMQAAGNTHPITSPKSFAERVGKTDITPDSPDLDRTGMQRGKKE